MRRHTLPVEAHGVQLPSYELQAILPAIKVDDENRGFQANSTTDHTIKASHRDEGVKDKDRAVNLKPWPLWGVNPGPKWGQCPA
jgi:hypothetical protein